VQLYSDLYYFQGNVDRIAGRQIRKSRRWQVGARTELGKNADLDLRRIASETGDTAGPNDQHTLTYEGRLSNSWDALRLELDAEFTHGPENAIGGKDNQNVLGAQLDVDLNADSDLTLRVRRQHSRDELRERLSYEYGLNLDYEFSDKSAISIDGIYFNSDTGSSYYVAANYLQRISDDARLGLDVRRRGGGSITETAYGVELALDLHPRIRTVPVSGAVGGTVYRLALDGSRSPLSGVKVSIGSSQAMTDEQGRFAISNLREGTYAVTANLSALSGNYSLASDAPAEVTVSAGAVEELELAAIEKSNISGHVYLAKPGSEPRGITRIVIELIGTEGVKRKLTDPLGYFNFSDVLPGNYTLSIWPGSLNAQQQVEPVSIPITIGEAESKGDLVFNITEHEREIEITTDDADSGE
jgi:hypothetical protein